MLLHIPGVLSAPDAARCREMLEQADWFEGGVDGPESAQTRHSLEIPEDHPLARQIGGHILDALQSNALFLSAALPLRVFPPLFNRYQRGDSYGAHVDNSIRQVAGTPHRVRTDLSATLFLSNPDEYEGGHMTVEDACGAQNVKLPAGHMVLYPGTSLHHVRPVTRGARVASIFWIQSMVRDDGKRTLLFDMDMAIQRIAQDTPDHASLAQLTGVYHNLIRRWAEL